MINKFNIKGNARILLKASFIFNFGIGLFAPIYAIFVQKIGGDILDAGIAFAIYFILTGIFVIAFDTSKFYLKNVKKMIILGYFLFAIAYFLFIFIKTPMHLFLLQMLLGLATGIADPAWEGVFSAKGSEKKESKNWAIWTGGVSIIAGISAVVGGIIVTLFSFEVLFGIMSALCLLASLISIKIIKTI
jgi:MFS family permease